MTWLCFSFRIGTKFAFPYTNYINSKIIDAVVTYERRVRSFSIVHHALLILLVVRELNNLLLEK